MCFASGSVTKSVLTVEVNNASKSDSCKCNTTITFTGRELMNAMRFASDSDTKSDPPVEVNNASELKATDWTEQLGLFGLLPTRICLDCYQQGLALKVLGGSIS